MYIDKVLDSSFQPIENTILSIVYWHEQDNASQMDII